MSPNPKFCLLFYFYHFEYFIFAIFIIILLSYVLFYFYHFEYFVFTISFYYFTYLIFIILLLYFIILNILFLPFFLLLLFNLPFVLFYFCICLQAVKNYMTEQCQCHGLTGSCAMKTCWKKTPSFENVGRRLMKKFDSAVNVMAGNDGKTFMPSEDIYKYPGKEDIVYSEQSPDFCKVDRRIGSLGTRGRTCAPNSQATNGCDLMCCGRGYLTRTRVVTEHCQCRFVWCCNVTCKICTHTEVYHTCL